eukprot:CAMPEP_0203855834 /NCGR_PEP_ID=MMETSP0359-20131031/9847_1 /ASSEMBLY_ACC=CAM_ASM_000338 /TAXON_ID=268821 /ORGANISM="Scrippsiella Hangoei, Strain SHTV-5" /LENGTH=596 /DNA_ID=CAMNT_0050772401 /DNA_START=1 /DNA_END=1791 /DNA_ORIENTATION=-
MPAMPLTSSSLQTLTNLRSERLPSDARSISSCPEDPVVTLRFRGTFLDFGAGDAARSPRARSEPDLHKSQEEETIFTDSKDYVENLSDKLSSLWSTKDGTESVGSENFASLKDFLDHCQPTTDASGSSGSGGAPKAEISKHVMPSSRVALAEPSHLWKQAMPLGFFHKELRNRIHAQTKNLGDKLKMQHAKDALTAIEELPEHVEEVLQQSVAAIFEHVQNQLSEMRDLIQNTDVQDKDKREHLQEAVASLNSIPEIMWDSLTLQAAEAREIVRRRIDEVTQGLGKGSSDEELLEQIRVLPAEVQTITEVAVQAAVMESQVQAQQQFEKSMWQMATVMPQAFAAAEQSRRELASKPAASAEDQGADIPKANQVLAEVLLRAKADGADGDSRVLDLQSFAVASSSHLEARRSEDGIAGESPCVNNRGSIGHPELCPRPCVYFTNGLCQASSQCDFCHLPHPKRAAHLDKRHRDLMKAMPYDQRVRIVLPILCQKALQLDSSPETSRLLDAIGEPRVPPPSNAGPGGLQEPSFMTPTGPAEPISRKSEHTLSSALRCLSLRSLIVSLNRAPAGERQQKAIDDLLHHLRLRSRGLSALA